MSFILAKMTRVDISAISTFHVLSIGWWERHKRCNR